MRKIDEILKGVKPGTSQNMVALERVLTPFAQLVMGMKPVYMGEFVKELDTVLCKGCDGVHFVVNGEVLATFFPDTNEASIFKGEKFLLNSVDADSIRSVLDRIYNKAEDEPVPNAMEPTIESIFSMLEKEGIGIKVVGIKRPH